MRVFNMMIASSMALAAATAFAHDTAPVAKKVSPWKGTNVAVGGSATSGNTTSQQTNTAFNLSYVHNKWLWTSNDTFNFSRTKGKGVTTAKLYLMGQGQYNISDRNYAFQQLNYTDDRFDGYRYVANFLAGYGRRIIKGDVFSLDGQIGPGIQRTVKVNSSGDDRDTNLLAWAGSLIANWQISENGKLSENFNVTSSSQNVRYISNTSISANVMNHVALQLSFLASRDSKPLPGKRATNTTTTISLVYTFA